MKFRCKKCGGETFETREKGTQTGLYCSTCYTWQKWLNKAEVKETLAVTKECQNKFIEFNVSWAMNNISKAIDMHLIPRIEEATTFGDMQYCKGMLDAISDFLTDDLCDKIQKLINDITE